MRAVKRVVSTALWDDELVLNNFTPEDKYFMLYLLTNQYTTQLGIYYFPLKKVALDMGYSIESIHGLLDRFENKHHLIKYNKDTSEIAIKNYLRHSVVKGGKPVIDCLIKETKDIKDISLLAYVYQNLSKYIDTETLNSTVIEYINYIYINILKDKYIKDNNNDNERIVHESSTNRANSTRDTTNYDAFFDSVWSLYPRKEGKSSISNAKKKELYNVGYEKLSKAIETYAKEVANRDKQYILMGSTFFNTRYKDYVEMLDTVEEVKEVDSKWQ